MIQTVLWGLEYDWLAIDSMGHVGQFCTAGGGNAPSDVVDRVEEHLEAIKSLEHIAPTTVAIGGPCEDEFGRAAARGVFVFDSSIHNDPYARVAAPVTPALISDLPETLAIARRIQIRGDFRDLAKIPPHLIDELG
jgi:hypothetical protein